MNVVREYQDILQNIEFVIVGEFREHPELRDPEVIAALEKLIGYYTRVKKGPERSKAVFLVMKIMCELRREDGEVRLEEEVVGRQVPLRILILCLERLLDSARNWHKREGQRGYLKFVSQFIPE